MSTVPDALKWSHLASAHHRLARFWGLKPLIFSSACWHSTFMRLPADLYPRVPNAQQMLAICWGLHWSACSQLLCCEHPLLGSAANNLSGQWCLPWGKKGCQALL